MINGVIEWFQDPANWTGDDGVPHRLLEHGLLTLVASSPPWRSGCRWRSGSATSAGSAPSR